MTRRWLVSCVVIVLGASWAATTAAQSPSLADRIKQLRRDWTDGDEAAEPEPELADEYKQAAPQRVGSARNAPHNPAVTAGRGGLPQVDPRSMMPGNLFSRGEANDAAGHQRPATTRKLESPAAVGTQAIARKSPTTGAEASHTQTFSSARRSPTTRPQMDVNPNALHDELTGVQPRPAAAVAETAEAAPTILDDFAAGLANEKANGTKAATTPAASTSPAPTKPAASKAVASVVSESVAAETAATGPITLPSTPEPAAPQARSETPVAARQIPAATPAMPAAASDNRYGAPAWSSEAAPQAATADVAPRASERNPKITTGETSEAAKAFQFGTATPTSSATGASTSSLPLAPRNSLVGKGATSRRESFSKGDQDSAAGPGVLVTNSAPAISSDIRGPKQIAIGRQASYRVRLQNQGGSAADAVVALVRVPTWAEVVSTTATGGVVREIAGDDTSSLLQWQLPRLDAAASETLNIDLVPRASQPLELGVSWTHDPVATRTVVEVQEPKLKLEVSGPDEVLYNKSHVYRLTLSNPGTGVAENVRINLMPPGGGNETVSTFQVGDLPPGMTKAAEVELTAREAGKLTVQAVAIADGDLKAEAVKELFCRKPELEVDWRGPETQYAGTTATYFFRVRNPGTAAADDVAVQVSLPAGAEFVSASEGNAYDAAARQVAWRVGSLAPGDDCYMELRCKVATPGENKLAIHAATAAGDLADKKEGLTNVVALADLKLDVSDPSGPVAVGAEAIYEIRVTNRGASAAEEVNVVGLFSAGLEPETVEGAPYTVSDGRVSFRTINKIPAGQDIVLQIRAKATEPGTHVFRAEVLCRDLEIKLAAEETTRFYRDEVAHDTPAPTQTTSVGAGQ